MSDTISRARDFVSALDDFLQAWKEVGVRLYATDDDFIAMVGNDEFTFRDWADSHYRLDVDVESPKLDREVDLL